MRILHYAVALIVGIIMAGCSDMDEQKGSLQTQTEQDSASVPEWTVGIIDGRFGAPATTLIAVRTAIHDGFDRTVFEFSDRVPGYHTEYIDRPVRKCASGNVTQLAGDGWLEVRMYPVHAHTEEGRPTVAERERMPGLPVLAELELTCDFEALVTWVVGVESPNRYRVHELGSPPRLVVDVRH